MPFEQDLYIPPRLLLLDTSTRLTPNHQLRWQRMEIGEAWQVPNNLQQTYQERLASIKGTITKIQQKVLTHDTEIGRTPKKEVEMTRKLAKMLFPCLEDVIREREEERLFHGLRLEDYLEYVAIPEAVDFRDWLISEHLPPKSDYTQELELFNVVASAVGILDLVRLFGGITVTEASSNQTKNTIYNRKVDQQVTSMLGIIYLFALTDLTRDPDREQLLKEFDNIISNAYPSEEKIRLIVQFNDDFSEVKSSNIIRKNDDQRIAAQIQERASSSDKTINHGYEVRIIGGEPHQFAIFDKREKKRYSSMMKTLRGRVIPPEDEYAARFILGDKKYIPGFIDQLRKKLGRDWVIEKEAIETRTPSSRLPYPQIKYHAKKKEDSTTKIEVVFEWLYDHDRILEESSWIPYRYLKDINWEALRVRQLLEGPLQHIFPRDCFGVDWDSEDVKRELYDWANHKAIYPLVQEISQ